MAKRRKSNQYQENTNEGLLMDYKLIQENILGLSFDNYDKVSVLDKEDFDIEYQESFKIIINQKSDFKNIYKNGLSGLLKQTNLVNYNNLSILVLLMVERRFEILLIRLIDITTQNNKSPSNALILSEIKESVDDNDIFVLIEGIPDFMEGKNVFAESDIKRFKDLKKYVEKRVNRIREIYK